MQTAPAVHRNIHPDAAAAQQKLFELAGGEPVWAVLDGAQDERIASWVRGAASPWACLYSGELAPELEEVAPYMLRLAAQSKDTARIFETGWQRNWAVFAVTTAPQADLRRHLRRHLRVQTEKRKTLLLRWYDPRVLRIYLPTCNAAELGRFFGPVRAFVAEGTAPRTFQVFSVADGKLSAKAETF